MTELITLAVVLAIVFIGPPVTVTGRIARHNAFRVIVPPDSVTESQGQTPKGRRAQEVAEWRLCWLVPLPIAALALFVIPEPFYAVLAFLFAAMVGNALVRVATDSFDYVGHGIEIMIAEDEGRKGYREAEIERMLRDKGRAGMTPAKVEAKLAKWNWLARFARRFLA